MLKVFHFIRYLLSFRYNPENPRQHRSQPPRPKSSIDQRFWAAEDNANSPAVNERQR